VGAIRSGWLWTIQHTLNHWTSAAARSGGGPFSLIRHVGRRSGKAFETPVVLAEVPEGFVCELTYGADVNWYRNIVAAGECDVVHRGREYHVSAIEPLSRDEGLRAFGGFRSVVLRILRRHEFRLLRVDGMPADGK
jgi:deazaflavin-dependent oxidoreductase (nitroreductase family)